jgi:hypothetical protein
MSGTTKYRRFIIARIIPRVRALHGAGNYRSLPRYHSNGMHRWAAGSTSCHGLS